MADIRPFNGIRFNQDLVKDVGAVLCPPYMQHALYHKSPYNMVRLEHGLAQPGDSLLRDKYAYAADTFREWLGSGILKPDPSPAMYLHHHYFHDEGKVKTRRGIMAGVRLEEWEQAVVRPHEGTAAVFKIDRLNLLRSCHASFSPILSLYEDPEGNIAPILATVERNQPLLRVAGPDGEGHTLWIITDEESLQQLTEALAHHPLYIADGHHRYETALAYKKERHATSTQSDEEAVFDFVMMTLVEFSDPGLVVLPFHRLIRGVAEPAVQNLKERLLDYFDIEALPLTSPLSATILQAALRPAGEERVVIGALGLDENSLLILRLRHPDAAANIMPGDRSAAYRSLGVSILHHVIIEKLLEAGEKEGMAYTHSELEAWQRVTAGEYRLAFLLNPVDARGIKAIADASDKMPQKSTHFYPKAPAGLAVSFLNGDQQGRLL